MMLWAELGVEQGAWLQMLLALGLTPTSGTLIPRVGMAKVCPTPLPDVGVVHPYGLAVQRHHVPGVPCTRPHCWLRNGLPESNCSMVRLMRVWAGTFQMVEWIHWPWGFWTR